ncbi:MAG TPA: radical SAM protein [Gaiellaceae bacterium]|jgi:organic radical activating enzyme
MSEVGDAKVHNPTCEINVVEHCNLSCRACSHASPVLPRTVVDPAVVEHDLSLLAEHYGVDAVRLLGGEPLLHPDLGAIVEAVRRSGIGERICVVTNGVLLPRMPRAFWESVDIVEISAYPGNELEPEQLQFCREEAEAAGTQLKVSRVRMFRESYSEVGTTDAELIRRIYRNCVIAHVWRNHTVANGVFYKCPQSYLLPKLLGNAGPDGVAIGAPELGRRLREYLASPEPLDACGNCLGSAGRRFAHEQTPRSEFRRHQGARTEELVDPRYLDHQKAWPAEPEREAVQTG